jgi:hypothetical protein
MTIPLDASSLNFRSGLELGRAARVFYSVKQLKTVFRARLGQKKFSRASRYLPTPVQYGSWAGLARTGPGPGQRAGLKMLRYTSETSARPRRRAGTPPGRCGAGGSCASAEGLCPGRLGGEGPPLRQQLGRPCAGGGVWSAQMAAPRGWSLPDSTTSVCISLAAADGGCKGIFFNLTGGPTNGGGI